MLTSIQAAVLGVVQGVTELFPISSLGHSVIIPSLFGWNIDQNSNFFVIFLVVTHLATALVLIGFFLKDWINIIGGFFRSLLKMKIERDDTYAKLAWLIIIGTIPAGLLGLLLEKKLGALFAAPALVSFVLILNGVLLYSAEILRRKQNALEPEVEDYEPEYSDSDISRLSLWQALKIGFAQCLALIPGFSRTGSTLAGGLLTGLDHEDAARFAFLLATPIILAAAVLKIPELTHAHIAGAGKILTVGFISAGICAYLSVKFLTNYFKRNTLTAFAVYCIVIGVVSLLIIHFR